MSGFTVEQLLFEKVDDIDKLYNINDMKKEKIFYAEEIKNNEKFASEIYSSLDCKHNAYRKLIEAVICTGNIFNLMKLLEAYVTRDRSSPDMEHAIRSCLEYTPLYCAREMYEELIKSAILHQNYDERLVIPVSDLFDLDKRGILNREREELVRLNKNPEDLVLKCEYFTGFFEKSRDDSKSTDSSFEKSRSDFESARASFEKESYLYPVINYKSIYDREFLLELLEETEENEEDTKKTLESLDRAWY